MKTNLLRAASCARAGWRLAIASASLLVAFNLVCRHSLADTVAPAANITANNSLFGQLKIQKNGVFDLDGVNFSVQHKSWGWAPARQRDLQLAPGFPQTTPGLQIVKGTLKTDSGPYQYDQELRDAGGAAVDFKAALNGTPLKDSRVLCLTIDLPVNDYRGQSVYFDGVQHVLPWWFKGQGLLKGYQHARRISVPLTSGDSLELSGDFEATIEDNREFGAAAFSLEIAFSSHSGAITESHLTLNIKQLQKGAAGAVAFVANLQQPPLKEVGVATPQQAQDDPKLIAASLAAVQPLARLTPRGEDFVDPKGKVVRFWGMNLVAFYPDHNLAEKTADNLASVGINLVRLHHNMRPSTDWAPRDANALVTYEVDSRTPNLKAWDRYDYMNACLRRKNIYLSVSMHSSRSYLPSDVAIKKVSAQDDAAWAAAMDDLNHWTWRKAIDPRKMLPVFDERCFLLNVEFAKQFLGHVNPYTGLAYGRDPQVATVELINEFSTEYTLTTGNKFPAYWTAKINGLLGAYAQAHGLQPFDIYARKTKAQQVCFSQFCNGLDQDYARRMEAVIRAAGYSGPIEFSNLWRGDASLRGRALHAGFIEDHAYLDPLVVKNPDNFLYDVTKSAVVGKPLIVGELNQSENTRIITEHKSVLSMLPLATAAYASLQNDAGIVWFAWAHGTFRLGPDGWGKASNGASDDIGTLAGNSIMLDHLRSAGIVFTHGYLSPSSDKQTIYVDNDYTPNGYADLMRGEFNLQPGWQIVHSFRKVFGAVPAQQSQAEWFKKPPADPTVADTGQITRNAARGQLTFAAAKTEGFSGTLDGGAPANLKVLGIGGNNGFATVIVVTLDDSALKTSRKLLVSKTDNDAAGHERATSQITLRGLAAGDWKMNITRPGAMAPVVLRVGADGILQLPLSQWHECELSR